MVVIINQDGLNAGGGGSLNYRVGIDIGGTFTDMVFLAGDGSVLSAKVPSTPDDYSRGIAEGIRDVFAQRGLSGGQIQELIHGTTIATNAILEKKGASTGLITTIGFRDVLEIRRLRMPVLYDLKWQKPEALARRAHRMEVRERINHRGAIEQSLDEDHAAGVIDALLASGVQAIAVCLLNAYTNGAHEQRIAALIRARDADIPVCLSSEVLPEIKEYERTSTTVVNAYITPVVRHYLRAMETVFKALGIEAPLRIMQSNGGTMGVEAACLRPIHIIESGPASGVVGAAELARKLGYANVLTFDMGGTTAKASMIENGIYGRVGALHVGGGINMSGRLLTGGGYHVSVPAIDIAEVGAGGGSLVQIDPGGSLRVGPESAGASPGPVCYDQGGDVATVTDANVILGFINRDHLVGGGLRLNHNKAAAAIEAQVARPLGVSLEDAAFGVHLVADAMMTRALRSVSSERGRDPRGFVLMAFGGNGGVHAATLARSLEIGRILVPPASGVFSALGLLFPATEHHYVQTYKRILNQLDIAEFEAQCAALEETGRTALAEEGFDPARMEFERFADLRYRGENSELTVQPPREMDLVNGLAAAFAEAHDLAYGYSSADETLEIFNIRVIARGLSAGSRVPEELRVRVGRNPAATATVRRIYFGKDDGWHDAPIMQRGGITSDWHAGPLIVDEYDTTVVVPPRCRIRRTAWDILEIMVDVKAAG